MLFKKEKKYEWVIRQHIKKLEEERMTYWNKAQEKMKDVISGDMEAAEKIGYYISCMNNVTYELQLLREILFEANQK